MCLSYCHRLGEALFWNHRDCHPCDCDFAGPSRPAEWQCVSCRHQEAERCGLTGAPLPKSGGCCHYNVTVATGNVLVRRLVNSPWRTTMGDLLDWLGVAYQGQPDGAVWVNLSDLRYAIPETYGVGTEPEEEEEDCREQTALPPEDEQRFDLREVFV